MLNIETRELKSEIINIPLCTVENLRQYQKLYEYHLFAILDEISSYFANVSIEARDHFVQRFADQCRNLIKRLFEKSLIPLNTP
ncbi:hypothetical protein [Dapis sp. BLCC M126]|uniref:hypothetical protein n=1 Tax=Dapis sp. BLCC M126 TaxID=3400189 RepID=UPI003CF0E032